MRQGLMSMTISSIDDSKPFLLHDRETLVLEYAGKGQAGYIFRVGIDGREHVLKMVS